MSAGFGKITFSLLDLHIILKVPEPVFSGKATMFKEKIYPYLLTTAQLGSLAFLGLSAPVIAKSWDGILLEVAGIFLALHAIFVAGMHNVNITPTPKTGGILITGGPYRLIRHPMYLAQIVAIIPLVSDYFTLLRFSILVLLIVTLILKMHYEEKGLIKQFGEAYIEYREKTKKVLPFIY
ncbi:MAG: isoprenylcysteine carboxyl methyltransferase [bacterium]|nr:MAG: isoprenylcysteine carboxyl methyltransferase [bacterium]